MTPPNIDQDRAETMDAQPSRRVSPALLCAAAAAFLIAGGSALLAIPRGPAEFDYLARPTLWPLPFAAMNGFTPEQLSSHAARLCFLLPAVLLSAPTVGKFVLRRRHEPPPVWASAALAASLVLVAAMFVFRSVPIQDDEPTYLMQAEALRHGALMHPPTPAAARFSEPFTVFTDAGTTGKYLFGEPVVLAAGMIVGFPLAGHLLLVAMTIAAVGAAARRQDGAAIAPWAVLLLAISPQFVFTSAVPLSQAAALAGVAVAVWGAARRDFIGGVLAGLGLGFAFVSRPQMAFPCGIALAITDLARRRATFAGTVIGALPWLGALIAYNTAVTGSPWMLPWGLAPTEHFGFGSPFGGRSPYEHSPWKGVALAAVTVVRLNGWAFGWPLSLAGPVAWVALRCPRVKAIAPWAAICVATFVFQFGYYCIGVSDTGAIYHHACLPFFALSTVAAVERLCATRWRTFAVGMCAASTIVTGTFYVEHAARLRRLTDAIGQRLDATALATPAVVFTERPRSRLPSGWVLGTPYRERWEDQPVVVYPLDENSRALREYNAGRHCYVRYADAEAGGWSVIPCDDAVPPRKRNVVIVNEWPQAFRWATALFP